MILVVLQRKVTWRVEDEEKVKKNFHTKASHTLSQMFKDARQEGKRLAIMFETASRNTGTCLCIDPNVIQLKRIVCLKKVDVCTLEDLLVCMNTLFVWYDFHIIFLY